MDGQQLLLFGRSGDKRTGVQWWTGDGFENCNLLFVQQMSKGGCHPCGDSHLERQVFRDKPGQSLTDERERDGGQGCGYVAGTLCKRSTWAEAIAAPNGKTSNSSTNKTNIAYK